MKKSNRNQRNSPFASIVSLLVAIALALGVATMDTGLVSWGRLPQLDGVTTILRDFFQLEEETAVLSTGPLESFDLDAIPAYVDSPYVMVNDNVPFFADEEFTTESYEFYSDLDWLGRCGITEANIGVDIMPTEDREDISSVKPTGWVSVSYDIVDGSWLYNRCHLIGFQLAGENDNELNLITGTRYMNVDGMLPFENLVADYVQETEHHVQYRVTPIFDGDNLVASGVLMEAMSVENDEICFNVYCYNVQPGIAINYANGVSEQIS